MIKDQDLFVNSFNVLHSEGIQDKNQDILIVEYNLKCNIRKNHLASVNFVQEYKIQENYVDKDEPRMGILADAELALQKTL